MSEVDRKPTALTSEERKLWCVKIERTIMVEAEREAEAEQIALRYEAQESMNDPDSIQASVATDIHKVPGPWHGSIPYHGSTDRTCAQILASQLESVHD